MLNNNNLVQVFNLGRPSGWLGQQEAPGQQDALGQQGQAGQHWFQYSSRTPQQPWFSLLVPPSQTLHIQGAAFPAFSHLSSLADLPALSNQWLGTLSFANPDAPVVRPRRILAIETLQNLDFNELAERVGDPIPPHHGLLVQTDRRFGTADTLAYPALPKALHNLPGHRLVGTLSLLPRPDFNPTTQQRLGAEHLHSSLGLGWKDWENLLGGPQRLLFNMACEAIRTYSRQHGPLISQFKSQLNFICSGVLNPYWLYRQPVGMPQITQRPPQQFRPQVLGLTYLPRLSV